MGHKNAAGSTLKWAWLVPVSSPSLLAGLSKLLRTFCVCFFLLFYALRASSASFPHWGRTQSGGRDAGRGRGNCHSVFAVAYSVVKSFLWRIAVLMCVPCAWGRRIETEGKVECVREERGWAVPAGIIHQFYAPFLQVMAGNVCGLFLTTRAFEINSILWFSILIRTDKSVFYMSAVLLQL